MCIRDSRRGFGRQCGKRERATRDAESESGLGHQGRGRHAQGCLLYTSTVIHNIELYPGQGAAMARSAGSYAQLLAREGKFAIIKLPSGETRMVLVTCRATVGVVSNIDHSLESSGKAGRERWLGRRPRNRGVVMNPVDHPMGGGEGRASGGHPRSRKGLLLSLIHISSVRRPCRSFFPSAPRISSRGW